MIGGPPRTGSAITSVIEKPSGQLSAVPSAVLKLQRAWMKPYSPGSVSAARMQPVARVAKSVARITRFIGASSIAQAKPAPRSRLADAWLHAAIRNLNHQLDRAKADGISHDHAALLDGRC